MRLNIRVAPAPLDLCYYPTGFDLRSDTKLCPPERNVLHGFYVSAKGTEWTESENWAVSQNDHCLWHGVTCKDDAVTELNLPNNGLSGRLLSSISKLRSMEVLALNDNDMKVCV